MKRSLQTWVISACCGWCAGWGGLAQGGVEKNSEQVETLLARGEFALALPLLEAMQDRHEHPQTDDEYLAAAAHALALGQTYRQLQDLKSAREALSRADAFLREHPSSALLGSVRTEQAELQPNEAGSLLEEAWQAWRQCADTPELAAVTRLRWAEMQLSQADYPGAQRSLQEARNWLDQPSAQARPECRVVQVRLLHDLGRWQLVVGNYPAAAAHFSQALKLAPNSPNVLADQALAQWRSGEIEAAAATFEQARTQAAPAMRETITANYAAALLSWMPAEIEPEALLEQASKVTMLLQPRSLSAMLTLAEAQRLTAQAQAQLGQSALAAQADCQKTLQALELREDFKTLPQHHPVRRHASITRWALEAMRQPEAAQSFARAALESGLAQLAATETLATEAARLAFLDPLDVTSPLLALPETERLQYVPGLLGAFSLAGRERLALHTSVAWRETLPPRSCLLAYFTFRKPVGTAWLSSVGVVLLTAAGESRVIDLQVSTVNLARTLQQLRERPDTDAKSVEAVLEKLGRQLWSPVRERLTGETERAFVFLEGELAGLPMPFLRHENRALLDGPVWCSFIAAPEALFQDAAKTLPLRSGPWIGVDASEVPNTIAPPPQGWEAPFTVVARREFALLTNVAEELREIAALHPPQWSVGKYGEAELRDCLVSKQPRVWHFAGHGVTDQNARGAGSSLYANALICHGVSLDQPSERDGLLFASEIAALDLRSLDLAIFSACDSGRGSTQHGEAVFDLARACHHAGVRDVLVSAAPVQDAVAPELMREFYRRLLAGMDASQAAWEAQRSLSKTHPSLHAVGYFRLVRNHRALP